MSYLLPGQDAVLQHPVGEAVAIFFQQGSSWDDEMV